ncbi:MAG: hypothetical protein ABSF64_19110 [Bryobacteraceae bacterium]|jgi:hypothetical protein
MAQLTAISLSGFTATVQAAVKAAVRAHPQFKLDTPQAVAVSYLIRGIPVPDTILANVSVVETQAFANTVAANIAAAAPEALTAAPDAAGPAQGAFYSSGGHVIVGIPRVEPLLLEK